MPAFPASCDMGSLEKGIYEDIFITPAAKICTRRRQ
jgi:hypothetical protein